MKTTIARYATSLALAVAMLTTATAAFADEPESMDPNDAPVAGEYTSGGLEQGGAGMGVASDVLDTAAPGNQPAQITSGALDIGSAATGGLAPMIVRSATR